ncbi:MAG TPA: hypothetical protein VD867_16655 [Burkholderiales bacterium]|nr:hypothetical protein [Burkholderiales bacterium]
MQTNELVIYRDVFGGWRWECFDADGEARDSQFSYDTRSECVADAKQRGLLPRRGLHSAVARVAVGKERRAERSRLDRRNVELVQGRGASRDAPSFATSS